MITNSIGHIILPLVILACYFNLGRTLRDPDVYYKTRVYPENEFGPWFQGNYLKLTNSVAYHLYVNVEIPFKTLQKYFTIKVGRHQQILLDFVKVNGLLPCRQCVVIARCYKFDINNCKFPMKRSCTDQCKFDLDIRNLKVRDKKFVFELEGVRCYGYLTNQYLNFIAKNFSLLRSEIEYDDKLGSFYAKLHGTYANTYSIAKQTRSGATYFRKYKFHLCSKHPLIAAADADTTSNTLYIFCIFNCSNSPDVNISAYLIYKKKNHKIDIAKDGFGMKSFDKSILLLASNEFKFFVKSTLYTKELYKSHNQFFKFQATKDNVIQSLYMKNNTLIIEWINFIRHTEIVIQKENNVTIKSIQNTQSYGSYSYKYNFTKVPCFLCVILKNCIKKNCKYVDRKCILQKNNTKPLIKNWEESVALGNVGVIIEFEPNCEEPNFHYHLNIDTVGDEIKSMTFEIIDQKYITGNKLMYSITNDTIYYYRYAIIYLEVLRCRLDKKKIEECSSSEELELKFRCGYLPKVLDVNLDTKKKIIIVHYDRDSLDCPDLKSSKLTIQIDKKIYYTDISKDLSEISYNLPHGKTFALTKLKKNFAMQRIIVFIKKCSKINFCTKSHDFIINYYSDTKG